MTEKQAKLFVDYLDYLIVEHANKLVAFKDYPDTTNVDFHFKEIKETQQKLVNLLINN